MRQWELFGITDQVEPPSQTRRFDDAEAIGDAADHPVFLWSTDMALRLRTVTQAAASVVGRSQSWCEGQDLIGVFGMEGANLAILEAHIAALNGATVAFELRGEQSTVQCTVAPTHDPMDRVAGTLCLATAVSHVDVREASERLLT